MMRKVIPAFLACWLAATGATRAQPLDQEMSGLAGKISKSLAAQGFKHVAAIDFTDLQGQPTELGRFLSEQLAVEIVSGGGVSMVDRANIKSILAEHKLTEEGLVNPANAKKLGEFAGVDAILIGNVTSLDDGIVLMVKAIATSSADIVAAGRIKFTKTSEIQQLLNRGVSSSSLGAIAPASGAGAKYQDATAIATKDLGSLRVVLKSVLPLKLRAENGQNLNGIRCSFDFINLDTHLSMSVAANAQPGRKPGLYAVGGGTTEGTAPGDLLRTTLVDDRGTVWKLYALGVSNVTGLGVVSSGQNERAQALSPTEIAALLERREAIDTSTTKDSWGNERDFVWGSTTPVLPGESVSVVMNFREDNVAATFATPPTFFQFNGEIVVGIARTGRTKAYSLHNLTFDRVSLPGKI